MMYFILQTARASTSGSGPAAPDAATVLRPKTRPASTARRSARERSPLLSTDEDEANPPQPTTQLVRVVKEIR